MNARLSLSPRAFIESSESAPTLWRMVSPLLVAMMMTAALSDFNGLVVDQSGGVVSGASVRITSASMDSRTETSDTLGAFRFRDVVSGDYELTIERDGFKPISRRVSVGARTSAVVRFKLDVAELQQRLTVTASDTQVNTESGENMDVVKLDHAAIAKLPVLGNDIIGAAADFVDAGALGAGGVSVVVDGMQTSENGVTNSAIRR